MIKKVISVAAAVLLIVSLEACGSSVTGSNIATGNAVASGSTATGNGSGSTDSSKTVMGRVTAINGSTITMEVMNGPAGAGSPGGSSPPQQDGQGGPGPGAGNANPSGQPDAAPTGTPQNSGNPGGESFGVTTTINVGTDTVVAVQSSAGNTAGTISDIAVGDTIAVTVLGEKAVSISVMNSDAMPDGPGNGAGASPTASAAGGK